MGRSPLSKNNVTVRGEGSALVFGHGFGADQRAWRFVAPAFESTHRVVCFDHVGSGGSDLSAYAQDRHALLHGFALDLLDVLDALDLHDVVYVGHSVGGIIGLLASIEAPQRFRRLVLLGSSPRFVDDPPDYVGGFQRSEIEGVLELMERDQIAWAEALAPMAIDGETDPDLLEDFGRGLRQLDPLVARSFGRLAFGVDCRDQLGGVTVPALLIHCTHDSIVPRSVARYLHERLAGSRLEEIDGHGHCPHLSHPDRTIALISEYLRDDA